MRFFPSQRLHLKRRFHGSFALLGLLCFGFEANAQKPVYRCETAGKVSYSDAPCIGAKEIMRYKQELAAVNSALGQGAKQIERDKIDAARFRRLCELHDSVETMWHVRGSDGQPIAVGGLASALDQKNELAKAF
jgi:hypothetical protein